MATGSGLVLVIQLLLTPVLSRIYLPEAYGTFSVYSALVNTMIIVSTLGLKNAVMLPHNKFRFLNLLRLNMLAIIAICLLCSVLFYFVGEPLVKFLQVPELSGAVHFIPLIAAVSALTELIASWYIKSGDFKTGPTARVLTNLFSRSLSIGYGFRISTLWWGLFWGDVISRVFAFYFLSIKRLRRFLNVFRKSVHVPKILEVMKGNMDFILYNFPSNLLSSFTSQLPIYLTGFCFGPQYVGYLGFATSLLYIPLNILGNSIYTVFYQRTAKIGANNVDQIGSLTSKIGTAVWILGIVPFVLLIGFGDYLFGWFLGNTWMEAGQLARYLGFYYFIFLMYVSTSAVFTVLGKQQYLLVVQIFRGVIVIASFGIGYYLNKVHLTFILFGIFGSIPYLIALIVLYRKLNLSLKRFVSKMLIVVVAIAVVVGIRMIQ